MEKGALIISCRDIGIHELFTPQQKASQTGVNPTCQIFFLSLKEIMGLYTGSLF